MTKVRKLNADTKKVSPEQIKNQAISIAKMIRTAKLSTASIPLVNRVVHNQAIPQSMTIRPAVTRFFNGSRKRMEEADINVKTTTDSTIEKTTNNT